MALAVRDRITEKAQGLLEPGETIQAVIPAQTKSGWLGAIGVLLLMLINRYQPIVVTDRRIVITDSGRFKMANPTSIVRTVPRTTQIGPASGLWWKCESLGSPLYVAKRFHKDVEAADSMRPSS